MGSGSRNFFNVENRFEKCRWWFAIEIKNKKSFLKNLLKGSIKQSSPWIGLPNEQWNSFCKNRDNWEESSIYN